MTRKPGKEISMSDVNLTNTSLVQEFTTKGVGTDPDFANKSFECTVGPS